MTQNELDRTAGKHLEFLWTTVAGCGEPAGERADLSWQNLKGLNLTHKDFSFAILKEADLSGAVAEKASFYGAQMQGATFRGCDLRDADLLCTDLKGSDLRGADLRGACLDGANLAFANLSGADLSGASLEGTYLEVDGEGFDWHSLVKTAGIEITVRTEEINSNELPPALTKMAGANLAGAKFKDTDIVVVVMQKRRGGGRRSKKVTSKSV